VGLAAAGVRCHPLVEVNGFFKVGSSVTHNPEIPRHPISGPSTRFRMILGALLCLQACKLSSGSAPCRNLLRFAHLTHVPHESAENFGQRCVMCILYPTLCTFITHYLRNLRVVHKGDCREKVVLNLYVCSAYRWCGKQQQVVSVVVGRWHRSAN
jgi:hypothetical protein